ncbi:hypothetical protein [Paracoccus ravus]|uniref:hypothetical protein n=1 Tax=Paracoccus ravus TaxID=2447760 RepID=UPI00106E25C5|nr:hypothetical protein [Paracoccus ravus]
MSKTTNKLSPKLRERAVRMSDGPLLGTGKFGRPELARPKDNISPRQAGRFCSLAAWRQLNFVTKAGKCSFARAEMHTAILE